MSFVGQILNANKMLHKGHWILEDLLKSVFRFHVIEHLICSSDSMCFTTGFIWSLESLDRKYVAARLPRNRLHDLLISPTASTFATSFAGSILRPGEGEENFNIYLTICLCECLVYGLLANWLLWAIGFYWLLTDMETLDIDLSSKIEPRHAWVKIWWSLCCQVRGKDGINPLIAPKLSKRPPDAWFWTKCCRGHNLDWGSLWSLITEYICPACTGMVKLAFTG